jgi:mannose-6-phosphate isomerase-like protein (cupin superfamily)
MGRLPFPPESKRPVVITPDMEVTTIYGVEPHQILVQKFVSTDKITMGVFIVQPGQWFEPPGIHPADEFYYILAGTATVLEPSTGNTFQVCQGETFFIPKGTWHQVFNFEDRDVKILSTSAPVQYTADSLQSEMAPSVTPRFFLPGQR